MRLIRSVVWLAVLGLVAAAAADVPPADDAAVNAALDAAGKNRGELETFLRHYADAGDAEKLAAARFLVAHMPAKGYAVYGWRGEKGGKVEFDALKYPNLAAAQAALDELEKEHGTIDYAPDRLVADLEVVTAKYLIHHVDTVFAAWRAVPAAERAPFGAFLEFILPYRAGREPIGDWIGPLTTRFAEIRKTLGSAATREALWRAVLADLERRVQFDELYYLHPTDQGFDEMEQSGKGRCGDLSTLQSYAARTLGMATAPDFTPAWANRDNNHAWIVTLDARGRGCDPAQSHAAKIYRKTYSVRRDNLAFRLPAGRTAASPFLGAKCYVDVTDQYQPVTDVTVAAGPAAGEERIAYLCVFNGGEWVPIHWGAVTNGRVTFTRMGRNHPYLPCVHDGTKLIPIAPPLILEPDGTVRSLPGTGPGGEVLLTAVDAGFVSMDTQAVTPTTHLVRGTVYLLQRWDGEWKTLEEFEADDRPRRVKDLPVDGLYWLVAKESRRLERIFTIKDGRQVWW